jgi:hypothetical protein
MEGGVTDGIPPAEWWPHSWGVTFQYCHSCREALAVRKKEGWELRWGFRTAGRRHASNLPWYRWSESSIRRIHGLNDPRHSAEGAWMDQRIRLPAIVTCKCGAENSLSLTRPEVGS